MATTLKDLMKNIIPTYAADEETSWTNAAAQFAEYIKENKNVTPQQLWADMLEYLQNETQAEYLRSKAGLPITEDLFNKTENITSLFEYINNNIDLPETFYGNLENEYKTYLNSSSIDLSQENGLSSSVTTYFWNESVSKLIASLIRQFSSTGISKGVSIDWTSGSNNYSVDLKNIVQPDAWKGGAEYVNPAKNTSGTTYKSTRGTDLITSDATNTNNLSYTNTQSNYSLRLGMPKYERKVMVEDLDRNFWVISQCVATISAYLFEENSPLVQLFKDILSELVQLWENLLYLWAVFAIALHNEKVYTDVRCEVVALSISECYHLRKYDNFSSYSILNTTLTKASLEDLLLKNLAYYKDEYPESNLVLMPFMRIDNYEHNYYREEWYPGLVFYDRNTDNWTVELFQDFGVNSIFTEDGVTYGCKFSLESFVPSINGFTSTPYKDVVWAITQAKRGEAVGYFPYSEVENLEEWDNDTYYAAIRCMPSLNFTYEQDSTTKEWSFVFDACAINVTDAIGQAIKKWANNLTKEEISSMTTYQQSLIPSIKAMNYLSCGFGIQYSSGKYVYHHGGGDTTYYGTSKTQIKDIAPFGYYLGELISGLSYSTKKYPELITYNVWGRPIQQDIRDWEIRKTYDGTTKQVPIWETDLAADNTIFNSLFTLDKIDIQHWKTFQNKIDIEDLDDFYFFTMTHQYGLYTSTTNYIREYYDYNNGTEGYYATNGLSVGDPIIKFTNGSPAPFSDSTISSITNGRRGNILSYGYFWNPFTKSLLHIPKYFSYSRININPNDRYYTIDTDGNKKYASIKFSDGTVAQADDFQKQQTFKRVASFKNGDGEYVELNSNFSANSNYVSTSHNRVDIKLTDNSSKLDESNWVIQNVNTTITYNCVFNYQQRLNGTYYHFGFRPFRIGANDEYIPIDYSDEANIVYQILSKNADNYYDLNEDDLYQAPFYTLGYSSNATDSQIIENFNQILNCIRTIPDANLAKAAITTRGLINNSQDDKMHIIKGYVTNINRLYLFPNGEYVNDVMATNLFNGHSYQNVKKIFSAGSNLDLSDYIHFQYDSAKSVSVNFTNFLTAWNTYTNNYYNAQTVSGIVVDSQGRLNTFKDKINSLKFSAAIQNGRIAIGTDTDDDTGDDD